MEIYLYNTLSQKKELYQPIIPRQAGIYTCGPTVYNYAHLGNLRTFLFQDFLVRTLSYAGYKVKRVMNITDVGHLSGDMDMGEDKMEKGSAREGRSAWEIASYYTEAFKEDLRALNMVEPDIYCRATDNIPEQISLVNTLEEKGFTYKTSDGVYFDTSKFPGYNRLSHLPLEELKEGARVEKNPEKKNPTDFALWKFSPAGSKRQMEWDSPWGVGFPGWHLECSAMSMKFLGGQRDIHCGGIDHINIHHTNEMAQSEAATGEEYFRYWLHGAFLNIAGGKKMAKSENNYLTLQNALVNKGIDPLAFRFAALQVHYRKPMDYSENSLRQAEQGLKSLYRQVAALGSMAGEPGNGAKEEFAKALADDLNLPQALAVLFTVLKSEMPLEAKLGAALDFDRVLGLDLFRAVQKEQEKPLLVELPEEVKSLLAARQKARNEKDWEKADALRKEIGQKGYLVTDGPEGQQVVPSK
ncbi:MAG: cysteine--tRNA ligase [Bacillota bacterium]